MLSSIIYKEFLKTYKVLCLFLAFIAYSFFQTFLDAKNSLEFFNATMTILGISQIGTFDFNYIKNISFLFALALGVSQFYSEVNQGRLRLYLHLPMTHLRLISLMIFTGFGILTIFFTIISFFYYVILSYYYPLEIFTAIYSKLLPLFLASILCYLAVLLGFLEPSIKKKILYLLIAYAWINLLFLSSQSSYFISYLINIVLLIFISSYIITAYEVFESYTKGYIK